MKYYAEYPKHFDLLLLIHFEVRVESFLVTIHIPTFPNFHVYVVGMYKSRYDVKNQILWAHNITYDIIIIVSSTHWKRWRRGGSCRRPFSYSRDLFEIPAVYFTLLLFFSFFLLRVWKTRTYSDIPFAGLIPAGFCITCERMINVLYKKDKQQILYAQDKGIGGVHDAGEMNKTPPVSH